ncbi:glucosaminidase domain-containing protein [Aquabacterium sp. A7-Y]|uniref:glycoside hydrolase family 73 protein n=1 Tax=Aquabacterium sp. A7-Y TaxID=1349605 RepID=UPI00223E0816|nr:glucosaminidase domain-containing protein [Aquabacterium sp. A7-Y]MCW7536533.1 glucosaminidase domain-containing protein [Aquabacterium sp. A7-Y]
MLRPEFDPFSAALPAFGERIAAPTGGSGSAAFALGAQVREEVRSFIEAGAGGSAATGLSVEGGLHRARLQAGSPASIAAAALEPAALRADGLDLQAPAGSISDPQQRFLAEIAPWADEAGRRLGVAPHLVAAHAALESGWGQHPLRGPDGQTTHNLFGIKAGSRWSGAAADAATTEYVGGSPVATTERFRSYPDAGSAFRDYAGLLLGNPRYREALNTGSDARAFAEGLARGGYATDPAYVDKLVRIATRLQSVE